MNIKLKDFQDTRVDELFSEARLARHEIEEAGGKDQAIVLVSPTGSGKTVMATGLMELILNGKDKHPGDEHACFLWLSDNPELNLQSKKKIENDSSELVSGDLEVIDTEKFKQRRFTPGQIYFLNIQKLSKSSNLVKGGDSHKYTIWQTIENTINESPTHFWLIIDEAHRGMRSERDEKVAATIVQKFVMGSSEISPVPLIVGVSATPERFEKLLKGRGTSRTKRQVEVTPEEVRGSGLLKETLAVFHPTAAQPADVSFLRSAAERLDRYRERWHDYCAGQPDVESFEPILIVQVEDAHEKGTYSKTNLEEAIDQLEDVLGPLRDAEIAHSFQEHTAVQVADRALRYVPPSDIQEDADLRVVFFKQSLNTGWDCPRAEVVMSYRSANDYTNIAQLIGRLVRTPLGRKIRGDDFLNSVSLYLPRYDHTALEKVRKYLTEKDTGLAAPPEFVEGKDLIEYQRAADKDELFKKAATLPSYSIERLSKKTHIRRLINLGRYLTDDEIEPEALAEARKLVLDLLEAERKKKSRTKLFKDAIASTGQIDVRELTIATPIAGEDVENPELEESFNEVAAATQNIDDIYLTCGRRLGEGLHKLWHKRRVAAGMSSSQAKAELFVLLSDSALFSAVEEACEKQFYKKKQQHKTAIDALSEERRADYRALNLTGATGTPMELELPSTMEAVKGTESYDRHLYVGEHGKFSCRLNSWERPTVKQELKRDDILGWVRNLPRKSWSFLVPYEWEGNDVPMYPDFLFFRRDGEHIVVDIIDPHWDTNEDSSAKTKGLAKFAEKHGHQFGRIEVIVKDKAKLRRLDVNRDDVRAEAVNLEEQDNAELRRLFGRYSTT
ncbi:MAG: DEAD/DEAH box helicase family protein [Solirubrobacteraceae bacterium]